MFWLEHGTADAAVPNVCSRNVVVVISINSVFANDVNDWIVGCSNFHALHFSPAMMHIAVPPFEEKMQSSLSPLGKYFAFTNEDWGG